MRRPVGKRITSACTIVEDIGPAAYWQVFEQMDGVELENAGKYCQRAVGMGLMTVDRTVYPRRYSVIPGWRGKIKPIARVKPYLPRMSAPAPAFRTHHLQGVWA